MINKDNDMKDFIGKSIIAAIKSLMPTKVPRHSEQDKEQLRKNAVAIVMMRSATALLLAAALIVGASGPAAAMDTAHLLTLFWGGSQQVLSGPGFPYTFPITLE